MLIRIKIQRYKLPRRDCLVHGPVGGGVAGGETEDSLIYSVIQNRAY